MQALELHPSNFFWEFQDITVVKFQIINPIHEYYALESKISNWTTKDARQLVSTEYFIN